MPEAGYVHRFVPSSTGSSLTLLLLHGTGGNESDLLGLGRAVSPDASLLSPRGDVLEDGMPRFFRRFAEGVFDVNDLVNRTHKLASFVEESSRRYKFDPDHVVALGYSNGANIAASMLILRPKLLLGAILARPMVPFVPGELPELSGKPILILAGLGDAVVQRSETEKLAETLRRSGADVTVHWQEAGHGLAASEVPVAREWLASGSRITS